MKKYTSMKDYKQWLVVCNSKHKHDPSLATPLCVVDTITRDDGLMFHLFLKQNISPVAMLLATFYRSMNIKRHIPSAKPLRTERRTAKDEQYFPHPQTLGK